MNEQLRIKTHFDEAAALLDAVRTDEHLLHAMLKAGNMMSQSLKDGNKIISCGNGGSMSDAMHFAEELSGRYRDDRPGLAAIACSDPSHITCVGNDYGFDQIFARYIQALGKSGDCLLAISTSGNSANVIKAAQQAKDLGMKVIGLTGKGGGELVNHCDIVIDVPWKGYADRIQEVHIKVIHAWIDFLESQA